MDSVDNAIKTRRSKFGMKTSSIKGLGIQTKAIQMGGGGHLKKKRHKTSLPHGGILDIKQACHMEDCTLSPPLQYPLL